MSPLTYSRSYFMSKARFMRERQGKVGLLAGRAAVTTLEYGIIAAFFAVLLVGIFGSFGKTLVTMFSGVTTSL